MKRYSPTDDMSPDNMGDFVLHCDAVETYNILQEALLKIALAGMDASPGTCIDITEKNAYHARRAWDFIAIAARALEFSKDARGHK